jgi:type VI secretion system protein ImpK
MRLSDYFMEVLAYSTYFLKNVDQKQAPFEQVKADIQRLLSQSDEWAKRDLFPPAEYDLARLAICAWVDEAVLNSSWQERDHWKREQLQRLYYRTTDAGEVFFERLNGIGLHQREVREIYFLCLALGFMGRYCHPGDEYMLAQVKSSNLKLLLGSSVGLPSLDRTELFPEAYLGGTGEPVIPKRRFRFSVATLTCLIGPPVLLGILYLIYNFSLNNIAEHFFGKVV